MVGILSTVGQFFSIELHQIEWFNFSFRDKDIKRSEIENLGEGEEHITAMQYK